MTVDELLELSLSKEEVDNFVCSAVQHIEERERNFEVYLQKQMLTEEFLSRSYNTRQLEQTND